MRSATTLSVLLIFSSLTALPAASPKLTPPRVSNDQLLITELPVNTAVEKVAVSILPSVNLDDISDLSKLPGDEERVAVSRRSGIVNWVRTKTNGDAGEMLDIRAATCTTTEEQGLLGLALAPDYAASGNAYLLYTPVEACASLRLSRFTAEDPASLILDPNSEETILELEMASATNLGGDIGFGPDGMLFIAVGDGGDEGGGLRAQDTTNLFGNILRIDVTGTPDPGLAYRIPNDNPFFSEGPDPATRKEIFAYGLRSPGNMSFDPTSNFVLWVPDAGESRYDEVNTIVGGENLGRGIMEGRECYPDGGFSCAQFGLSLPIATIALNGGPSVIGEGVVYTGVQHPELFGAYVYTTPASGRFYTIRNNGFGSAGTPFLLATVPGANLDTMGLDPNDEILAIDNRAERDIYTLQRNPAGPAADTFPRRLSQLPALWLAGKGRGHEVPGVFYYRPSAQLWTDNAHKERYIAVPGLEQIGWTAEDTWNYPDESVVIKNFAIPLDDRDMEGSIKRLETRILYFKDGAWYGYSYKWNEDETDAYLLGTRVTRDVTVTQTDGSPITFSYLWPSRTDCRSCHRPGATDTLGISTAALNFTITYPGTEVTANQLETLNTLSVFDAPIPSLDTVPKMPDYDDTTASIRDRAKAYFHANCQHCHRPGGVLSGGDAMDMRWGTPVHEMNFVDVEPGRSSGLFPIEGARLIAPGHPELSIVKLRAESLEPAKRMPPVATSRVDENGVAIISDWIDSLAVVDRNTWFVH